MPGPLVAVIARAPARVAPMHIPIEAISSSPWMAMPPTLGSSRIIAMRIDEAGVIGYPAKNVHPASSAPRTIAVDPSMYSRPTPPPDALIVVPVQGNRVGTNGRVMCPLSSPDSEPTAVDGMSRHATPAQPVTG